MSQLKVDTITDEAGTGSPSLPNGLTVGGVNYPSTGPLSNRNKIINGAMVIDQRNAGAAVTVGPAPLFPVDRFGVSKDTAGATVTSQRSTVVPAAATFTNSLLWTTSTGASPDASNDNQIRQYIEGFNFSDFGFGTAFAKPLSLSFWVRSSVVGTYGVSLANSAANRAYMATYTIAAANTWEFKTITIAGDTTGTWLIDSGIGLRIFWDLGAGSSRSIAASSAWGSSYGTGLTGGVKLIETTGATFYITGVQLEAGTVATPFEHRSFGQELALCQRYLQRINVGCYQQADATNHALTINSAMQTAMRSAPTASVVSVSLSVNVSGSFPPATFSIDARGVGLRAIAANAGRVEYAAIWQLSAEL